MDSARPPSFRRTIFLYGLLYITIAIVFLLIGLTLGKKEPFFSPLSSKLELPKPKIYDPYSFDNLRRRTYTAKPIRLEKTLGEHEGYVSHLFSFLSDDKKVTGLVNIPTSEKPPGGYPIIIQVRGYVDKEIYDTGVGTAPSAAIYAKNGFITLAPDFLGYGDSDPASSDSLLDRFENPVVILNLLASVKTLPQADPTNIFLWGHSNGGQISLSVLEISAKSIPTALWAPVTKPFPYSILYFMDESPDGGKYLRKIVATMETDGYDVDRYSIGTYFSDITAPIQLHQGTADEAVPLRWSNQFIEEMKKLGKDITYYTYEGADHNLRSGWDTVVSRDIAFFRSHLR